MSIIKLAIISDDPGRGGAYKVAADIAEGLDKSIYEVRWFFLCNKSEDGPEGLYLGNPPININYTLKSYLRLAIFPKEKEKSYSPLNQALAEYHPDIIHFHTHPILLSLIKGISNEPLNFGAKIVFTDHLQRLRLARSPSFHTLVMAFVYKKLFQKVSTVFISKYAFETAMKLGFGKATKDTLIENSVDVSRFKLAREKRSQDIKVVYLARLHPVKGHIVLLEAWKSLKYHKGLSLHIYGQENDGGRIRKSIEQFEYPNSVYYEGVTSSPETVLQNADIGVFPSFREGMPLALLEMMACSLPVIVSDIPEITSIITDGKNALLFECGIPEDMAKKIQLLIENESMRHSLGLEARKFITKNYAHSLPSRYHQFYQSIL